MSSLYSYISSDYTRGCLLAEGKTKQIYSVEGNENVLIVVNKDRITAHNAKTAHEVAGKAKMANLTNANIMGYLTNAGKLFFLNRVLSCVSCIYF